MKYNELKDYALWCSLKHHLCNVEELLDKGKTFDEIMLMVEKNHQDVDVAGCGDYWKPSALAKAICNLGDVYCHQLIYVLRNINGDEWVDNYIKEATTV